MHTNTINNGKPCICKCNTKLSVIQSFYKLSCIYIYIYIYRYRYIDIDIDIDIDIERERERERKS